jgi:hypothetical protein
VQLQRKLKAKFRQLRIFKITGNCDVQYRHLALLLRLEMAFAKWRYTRAWGRLAFRVHGKNFRRVGPSRIAYQVLGFLKKILFRIHHEITGPVLICGCWLFVVFFRSIIVFWNYSSWTIMASVLQCSSLWL